MVKLKVKTPSDVVTKWAEEAPRRAAYYTKYTPAAANDWFNNAIAAAGIYKTAITAPDIDKRFAGGIKKAGTAKFVKKVEEVGGARYGPGISAAKDYYNSNIAPYLDELSKIDIPARGARGDAGNLKRVEAISTALHKKRLALLAAGAT